MRIILASSNKDKIKEIKEILQDLEGIFVLPYTELVESFEIIEDGRSFKENALIKSRAVFKALDAKNLLKKSDIVLSDDSGICVDALNGAPGIHSARYSGGDSIENLNKLIFEVSKLKNQSSKAYYCASIAISSFYGEYTTHGFMYGEVISEKRGSYGFGYDPMFIPNGSLKTLAELSDEEKNAISHRKMALDCAKLIIKMLL